MVGLIVSSYFGIGILYYFLLVWPIMRNPEKYYKRKRKRILRKKHSDIRLNYFNREYGNYVSLLEENLSMISEDTYATLSCIVAMLLWPFLLFKAILASIITQAEIRRMIRRKKGGWK